MLLHSYSASANCLKVRLLLKLLDIPHRVVEVDIFAGATLTPEFAALNPLRETPVLELDDGTALTQSNAILSYLAEGTSWAGTTREDRARVAAWGYFEQERVVPGIGGVRFQMLTGRATREELVPRLAVGADALALLEAHLERHAWLVGDAPTTADVSVWAYAHLAGEVELATGPAFEAWSERLRGLEGFADDLEPYPDNAHQALSRSIYDEPPSA